MTLQELRQFRDSLHPGGTKKLAGILGRTSRTVRNKLSGATKITSGDVALIEKAKKRRL